MLWLDESDDFALAFMIFVFSTTFNDSQHYLADEYLLWAMIDRADQHRWSEARFH